MEFKDKEEKLLYRIQLDEFAHSMEKYGARLDEPLTDWFDAFHKLEDFLSKKRSKKKMVVFIDEMPWLDTPSNERMLKHPNTHVRFVRALWLDFFLQYVRDVAGIEVYL